MGPCGVPHSRIDPLPITLKSIRIYTAEVVEARIGKPGRRWARASLICAVWSLFVARAVFGPLGVAAGMVAVWKGDRWWGAAGVSVSAVAAVTGYFWAGWLMG